MSKDWYEEGLNQLYDELCELVVNTEDPRDVGIHIYSFLLGAGFIDYDIAKDAIWDRYFDDE